MVPASLAFLLGVLVALAAPPARAQVPVFDPHAAVDPGASKDAHADEVPRIAAGGAGVWTLVWQVNGASDLGLGRDTDLVFARTSDDGAHWSAPTPLSPAFASDRAEDGDPALASNGKGTSVVVWTSTNDLTGGSRRDRDIHYSVSADNGLSWSAPRALNSNAPRDWGDDGNPDVAVDGSGRWVVAWESADTLGNTKGGDRDILYAVSTDAGASWTAPEVVDRGALEDMNFDTSPRVVADAAGSWLVAWSSGSASEDRGGFQRGVLLSRWDGAAQKWGAPVSLSGESDDDRPDFAPRLAGDGKGHWICAWSSSDSLGDTIGKDRDLLLVRSDDDGRTWTKREPLNSEAASDSGDDDTPEIAADGAGNWLAVWPSWDRRGASRGADADLLMALSRDHGRTWSASAVLNTNAKKDRGEDTAPTVATDGAGTWIAAWVSTETAGEVLGGDRDIQVAVGRFGFDFVGPQKQ